MKIVLRSQTLSHKQTDDKKKKIKLFNIEKTWLNLNLLMYCSQDFC